jgi:hypothetical protein
VFVHGGGVRVPTLTVAEFCQKYHFGDKIRNLLDQQGFETAGAILEVSEMSLLEVGFKIGHIAEMKRALRQLLGL